MAKINIDNNAWQSLGLKADPFPLTPTPESEFVWAGQAQLKSELDEILKQARATETTQFVGLIAPWGSGKTHALGYYSHPQNLPGTELQAIEKTRLVPVTFPKSEKQIAEGFFLRVIDKLGWENVVKRVVTFNEENPNQFSKLIATLLQDNADLIRAFDYLKNPDLDEETSFVVQSYLFGEASKRDRNKLRFVRSGNTVEERYLSLNAFLALETKWKSAQRMRIVLWIDEAENLIKLSSSNFDPFTQGLRDVLDMSRKVYGCLTVVINFTPESRNVEGEMFAILGSALYDRLDKKISIAPMTPEDAKAFVLESLRGYGINKNKKQEVFSPEAIDYLPTVLGDAVTPRRINRVCSAILHSILTESQPFEKFPISLKKVKELADAGKITAALLADRPST
jgi:hypothetical protein